MKALKSFRTRIASMRNDYLAILAAALIILTILVVYWQDLSIIANEALQSESLSHILLVPPLMAYLLYQKRHSIEASVSLKKLQEKIRGPQRIVSLDEIIGLTLCLSAFMLYWYGSYTFYPVEYHLASLPLLVGGMSLIIFNRKALIILIFPILFLIFLVPLPSTITYTAGALLADFNTQASYTILRAVGLPVALSSVYGSPTIVLNTAAGQSISFAVDLACSGIYSLTAFTMFAAFLAYIIRGSIFRKTVLFALGFVMLALLNIVRISSIVFIGHQFGEEIAMTLFHTLTGWLLIFIGILLLLLTAEKLLHLEIFSGSSTSFSCSECTTARNSMQSFCQNCGRFFNSQRINISQRTVTKIVALLLGCIIVTVSINAPVLAFAGGEAVTSQNWQTSTAILPESSRHNLRPLGRDLDYERIAQQDASLLWAYVPLNSSDSTIYVLVGIADSITNLHSWEVCMVTWQTAQGKPPLVSVLDSRDVQILEDPPIIGRYFVFRNPPSNAGASANYTQVTLYWFETVLYNSGTTIQRKYARISLITIASKQDNYQDLEEELLIFGQSIAAHWEPLKQQSLVSLGVPLIQYLLAGTIIFAVLLGIAQYTKEQRKRRNNLKVFESFASPEEKLVVKTLRKLREETKETTLEAIHSALNVANDTTIKSETVEGILNTLEKNGMVKKDIANIQNHPKLIWKF